MKKESELMRIIRKRNAPSEADRIRNLEIVRLRKSGMPLAEIGSNFAMSVDRVNAALEKRRDMAKYFNQNRF